MSGVSASRRTSPMTRTRRAYSLCSFYVDDDLVLVHGREVWGYPKKIGQMGITPVSAEASDHYDYTVGRRGSHLVSGSVENLTPIDKAEFPFFGKAYSICYRQTPANQEIGLEKNELVWVHLEFEAEDTMKGTGSISIEDGPFDQIPIGPLTDITSYFGRCTFNHYGVADRVVETDDLARPLDLSRAGKAPVSV
ncbi:MAG: acetoacetate decarboxylase family protein [Microcella pacifica]